jgi:transcriptional regulator with XRE-family HTH domain
MSRLNKEIVIDWMIENSVESLTQLAAMLGVSASSLYKLWQEDRNICTKTVQKFIDLFGMSYETLFDNSIDDEADAVGLDTSVLIPVSAFAKKLSVSYSTARKITFNEELNNYGVVVRIKRHSKHRCVRVNWDKYMEYIQTYGG